MRARRLLFIVPLVLLFCCARGFAQAPAGFTKIATVTATLTYTDIVVAPSDTFAYVVTALNAAGQESGPSNTVYAVTPSAPDPTATTDCGVGNGHCNVLSWSGTTPPSPQFNVYRMVVLPPPSPTGLTEVSH